MLPAGSCILTHTTGPEFQPEPGLVVTFRHPVQDAEFVARIVATGGQRVQMKDGHLWIDGVEVPQQPRPDDIIPSALGPTGTWPRCANGPVGPGDDCVRHRATETLPNGSSYDVLQIDDNAFGDATAEFLVPEEHLFMLGDHRDNSFDSRFEQAAGGMGFVPAANVTTVFEEFLSLP